jgi:hypothetical protein
MKHAAAILSAAILSAPILVPVLGPLSGPAFAGNEATPEQGAAENRAAAECVGCDTPKKKYDSVEVIRTIKNVDRSRVINTTTVVPYIRGPVVSVPIVTRVQIIVHRYEVEEVPYAHTYQRKIYVQKCRHGSRSYYAPSCGGRAVHVRG